MDEVPNVVIRFKEVPDSDELREELERRCRHLAEEFPETTRFEVTLSQASTQIEAHAHVTGKDTNAAARATESDARLAGDRAIDKLERELRRDHDKRIFSRRRAAQRSTGKRTR